MNDTRLQQTLARRERRASRSVAVSLVLGLLALAAAYTATESVLAALGAPALLASPADALTAVADGIETAAPLAVVAAVALTLLGLVCLALALLPGRRGRHQLADDRVALLIDDDVLASALSRRASTVGSLGAAEARTVVTARAATTVVTPGSGYPVELAEASAAAADLVEALAPRPRLRTRVRLDQRGVLS